MSVYSSPQEEAQFKSRTVEQLWNHHNKSLAARDIDEFIKDFSPSCIFINNPKSGHAQGTFLGAEGVAKWCKEFFDLFQDISEFKVPFGAHIDSPHESDGVVMISWEIFNSSFNVRNGVDTFIVKQGRFEIVTVVYDVESALN